MKEQIITDSGKKNTTNQAEEKTSSSDGICANWKLVIKSEDESLFEIDSNNMVLFISDDSNSEKVKNILSKAQKFIDGVLS